MITVQLNGTVVEHTSRDIIGEKHLAESEAAIARQVGAKCRRFVDLMQNELMVDCIDISKYALAKERRSLAKSIDSPEFIRNANIRVEVKVHLRNAGEMR